MIKDVLEALAAIEPDAGLGLPANWQTTLSDELTILEGFLDPVPDPVNPPFYHAGGSVDSAGNAQGIAGASVSRISTGRYQITFTSPSNTDTYPVLATMQGLPQNDDYQWAYLNRTVNGFQLEIREQDNGSSAGVLRDSGFSFFVPIL